MQFHQCFILALGVATLAWSADIHVDHDHTVNFTQIRTYCWGEINSPNPLYINRIRNRVDAALQRAGWRAAMDGCDATVFANGNVHNQTEVKTFYDGLGGWGLLGWGGGTASSSVTNDPVGQLIIDVFDTEQRALIWRGILQRQISEKEEKNIKAMNTGIDKLFKNFPPKAGE